MNLQDLRYFVSVSKHLHFSKAAKECNISQPTLSAQIKKLERTLGINLFERDNKNVRLSDAGTEVLYHAKIIMQEQQSILSIGQQFQDPLSGTLKLGVIPTIAPYLIPKLMPYLKRWLKKARIHLIEEQTNTLVKHLQNGDIDAAILALPIEAPNLIQKEFFKEEFQLAVHPSHPLGKRKRIHTNILNNEKLLLLEDGHCFRDQVLEVCYSSGAKENSEFRATSLETLRQMVKSNAGTTLIPKMAVTEKSSKTINYIKFYNPKPKRSIGIIWRENSVKGKMFELIYRIGRRIK